MGCLTTVDEYVPATADRCRLADDERRTQANSSPYDIGRNGDVDSLSAAARGVDDNDDDEDAEVGGNTAKTLSRSQYVGRVVAEIIDTERAYVADLDQIIHVCTLVYTVNSTLDLFSFLCQCLVRLIIIFSWKFDISFINIIYKCNSCL